MVFFLWSCEGRQECIPGKLKLSYKYELILIHNSHSPFKRRYGSRHFLSLSFCFHSRSVLICLVLGKYPAVFKHVRTQSKGPPVDLWQWYKVHEDGPKRAAAAVCVTEPGVWVWVRRHVQLDPVCVHRHHVLQHHLPHHRSIWWAVMHTRAHVHTCTHAHAHTHTFCDSKSIYFNKTQTQGSIFHTCTCKTLAHTCQ